jgi:HEXXH motif-containing protein
MLSMHRLPLREFDALASGLGSATTIAALRSAQLSLRFIGLRAVLDAAERVGHKGTLPGIGLLSDVQQQDPSVVIEVLRYPFAGSWLACCLRLLSGGDVIAGDVEADLGHLSGVAAVAAIRAGVPFSIEVPVREGAVYLPTLGRLMTANGPTMIIHSDGREMLAEGVPLSESANWEPIRRISSVSQGQELDVLLDDIDPFRGGPQLPVASRLSDEAVRAWEHSLGRAWDILVRHHPSYADAIGAGLVAIVPMVATQPNCGVNATSRESFGSAALSVVNDPVTLAAGILHEFQHCKLNALLDLIKLYRQDSKRYYAPWREDPRPLGGLLHGAYAHIGVCDFWRVQATLATTPLPAYAQMEFARWSDRTGRVIEILLDSPSLTPVGERFISGMRERLRSWPEAVPEEPARLARTAAVDHRLGWRLRNMRPDAATVDALARAWRAGVPAPGGVRGVDQLVDGGTALGASSRLVLLNLRLREPDRLARLRHGRGIERADAELVSGNLTRAAAEYLELIRQEPRSPDGWTGLALALGRTKAALLHAPEVVCAVYNQLLETDGRAPDPGLLAEWMWPAVPADPFQVSDPVCPSRTR